MCLRLLLMWRLLEACSEHICCPILCSLQFPLMIHLHAMQAVIMLRRCSHSDKPEEMKLSRCLALLCSIWHLVVCCSSVYRNLWQ